MTEFEESIIKNSVIAKFRKVQNEYTTTNRSKRQITKVRVLATRDANRRIATGTEKENQLQVRGFRYS
jgi:hypothetical protein